MKSAEVTNTADQLILAYQGYVIKIVGQLIRMMNLPLRYADEFISAGYVGLVEAANRFDPSSGASFSNYAMLRIRGAIIDSIRRSSEVSGNAYKVARALRGAHDIRELEKDKSFCGKSSDERLSKILDFVAKGALTFRLSMEEAEAEISELSDSSSRPDIRFEYREKLDILKKVISELPRKERAIIKGYYFEGKSFAQIADEDCSLSRSWVSRIHARAVTLLKERFDDAMRQ